MLCILFISVIKWHVHTIDERESNPRCARCGVTMCAHYYFFPKMRSENVRNVACCIVRIVAVNGARLERVALWFEAV